MRIAALTLLLGSLCLAACDDTNDVVAVPGSRTGTFVLQTVNDHALPAIVLDSTTAPLTVEVVSGEIAIASNNAFIVVTGFRLTLGDIVSAREVTCTGTFTVASDTLTFVEAASTPECGRTFTGVLSGNSLSTSLRGLPAIYTR